MNLYCYEGPVMKFDTCVEYCWKAETEAVSEAKARCNFAYQYKKKAGLVPRTKISLPGKIKLIKEGIE